MRKILSFYVLVLVLVSCGETPKDAEVFVPKAKGPLANIKLSQVASKQSVRLSPKFHQRGISFEKKGEITGILHMDIDKEDANGVVNGSYSFTVNNAITGKSYTYGSDVFGFKILANEILIIEEDAKKHLKVSRIDFQGQLIASEKLIDPKYNEDHCYEEFDFAIGKKCGKSENGEVKLYRHSYPYQSVQIRQSSTKADEFFVLLDTARFSTNIYRIKINDQGLELLDRRQLLVHNNLFAPVTTYLQSGSEMHTLNRFGRNLEKIFGLTPNDEVIFGMEASLANAQNKFLGLPQSGAGIEDVAKPYSYFVKLNSELKIEKELIYDSLFYGNESYFVTAKDVDDKLYFGLTSREGVESNQYDYQLFSLDIEKMQISKSKKVDLAGSDYLTALSTHNGDVIAASFSGVKQNPHGYSIDGFGAIAMSYFDLNLKLDKSFYFRPAARKNNLMHFQMHENGFFGLFDLNGPVTHTADKNASLNGQSLELLSIDFSTSSLHWYK